MRILVTGAAGFIGMHVTKLLLEREHEVVGLDNLNNYYDPRLKIARVEQLRPYANFTFCKGDIADRLVLNTIFDDVKPVRVVNLAAQAGVQYSVENPDSYIQSNLVGFGNILESCRLHRVEHLVYASSSSVYGANTKTPFSVHDGVDHPVSLYAATKKCNELMAHAYSHLHGLPTTGLRYFTVYGPWGRPDMSPWLFTDAILSGNPINVFNHGKMLRDFTYVDDVAEGTVRVLDRIPQGGASFDTTAPDPGSSYAPYRIYNIGNCHPIELLVFVKAIEDALGQEATKRFLPLRQGDVVATYADIDELKREFGFAPKTALVDGILRWVAWYKSYSASR